MRLFSLEDLDSIFLSPYTQVSITENQLVIHQTLFDCTAVLHCSSRHSVRLLELMDRGTTEEEFLLFISRVLPDTNGEELLSLWMQMGVLE